VPLNGGLPLSPNEERQRHNLLGCDHWALSRSPEPTMVGFQDLVGVGIGPFSKKLAVRTFADIFYFYFALLSF
jgi:hypothetical protein